MGNVFRRNDSISNICINQKEENVTNDTSEKKLDDLDFEFIELTFLLESTLNEIALIEARTNIGIKMQLGPQFEFGLFGEQINTYPKKALAKHFITDVWLTSIENGFDASFAMNLTGLFLPTTTSVTDCGIAGCYIIKAKESFRNQKIQLIDHNKLKRMRPPKLTDDIKKALELTEGLIFHKNGTCLIKDSHPIIDYYNQTRIHRNQEMLSKRHQVQVDEENFYVFQSQEISRLIDDINEQLDKYAEFANLYSLGFEIRRAFKSPAFAIPSKPCVSLLNNKLSTCSEPININNNNRPNCAPSITRMEHDRREIFHGTIGEQMREFIVNEPKKLYISILIKYKNCW